MTRPLLDLAELKRWQGFGAIPYVGDQAFLVSAPFGWVIDIKREEDVLCTMYQRGLDGASARKNKEYLYISAWNRRRDRLTVEQLDLMQVAGLRASRLKVLSVRRQVGQRSVRQGANKRKGAGVRIRYLNVKEYKCLEVTGFLQFKDIIFFAVLLTPFEKQKPNIRRLVHVLQHALPVKLAKDNSILIDSLKAKLKTVVSKEEKATILADIGHWYRDMKKLAEARQYLEESVSVASNYYGIRELIHVLSGLGERHRIPELLEALLLLAPTNPTVYNDAIEFAHRSHLEEELRSILQSLSAKQNDDSLTKANCLFYTAQLHVGKDRQAMRENLLMARMIFRRLLPPEHQVFHALRFSLRQVRNSRRG